MICENCKAEMADKIEEIRATICEDDKRELKRIGKWIDWAHDRFTEALDEVCQRWDKKGPQEENPATLPTAS